MLIPSFVNLSSHLEESYPSRAASQSSIASASSLENTAPSAFEQLLARQIAPSDAATSLSQPGPGNQAESPSENGLQFSASFHSVRFGSTTTSEPNVTSHTVNSDSISYFAMDGLISAASKPMLAAGLQAEGAATLEIGKQNGSSTANGTKEGASNETPATASRMAAWQLASEESRFASLIGSVFNSKAIGNEAANLSAQLAVQDLSENISNEGFSASNHLSAGIEASSQPDDQHFLVHEFSVETTASAPDTSSTSGISESTIVVQPDLGKGSTGPVQPANNAQRTVQETKVTDDSVLIPGTSPSTTVSSSQDSPLAEELSSVVRQQLEQEPSSEVTTVRIQLSREDLGLVSLFLSISNNVVRVRIVAQDELARQLIESQMDELRQSLAEGGVECSEFQVVCDSTENEFSGQKRSSQPLISLGFSSKSRKLQMKTDSPRPDFAVGELNFTA